ncbi:MAG: transglycosylase SLT domain-containing protein [Firmicutes bacterium]|nr:transglycosylase SLT domain-containing protein [Bacillota bacterium]
MGGRLLLVVFFALGGLLFCSLPLLAPEPPHSTGKGDSPLLAQIELFIRNYQPALPQAELDEIILGILEASERHKIDPRLITSLIAAESGFRKTAVSRKGARGLTQIMPDKINGFDWREARPNIDCGTAYLRKMLDRFNSVPLALAAYNAGPTRVARNDEWPRETRYYVSRVLANYEELMGK